MTNKCGRCYELLGQKTARMECCNIDVCEKCISDNKDSIQCTNPDCKTKYNINIKYINVRKYSIKKIFKITAIILSHLLYLIPVYGILINNIGTYGVFDKTDYKVLRFLCPIVFILGSTLDNLVWSIIGNNILYYIIKNDFPPNKEVNLHLFSCALIFKSIIYVLFFFIKLPEFFLTLITFAGLFCIVLFLVTTFTVFCLREIIKRLFSCITEEKNEREIIKRLFLYITEEKNEREFRLKQIIENV